MSTAGLRAASRREWKGVQKKTGSTSRAPEEGWGLLGPWSRHPIKGRYDGSGNDAKTKKKERETP